MTSIMRTVHLNKPPVLPKTLYSMIYDIWCHNQGWGRLQKPDYNYDYDYSAHKIIDYDYDYDYSGD